MGAEAQPPTRNILICEACDWRYLEPQESSFGSDHPADPVRCPHCFKTFLTPLDPQSAATLAVPQPELVLPFSLPPTKLTEKINTFAAEIRFAPADLKADHLINRLKRVYLPMWLVDVSAQAEWQAEAGFDYQVVSHEDRYDDRAGWRSQEVTETRIRWEPRLGALQRTYHNTQAAALEEYKRISRDIGEFDPETAQGYKASVENDDLYLRLPNRDIQDAWPAALPALQAAAAEECRQAAGADYIRGFRWSPQFQEQHWTLMLLPVFTTYYLDDERRPHPLLIHGQTGQLHGSRQASMKRAQKTALILLAVAGILFLSSLLVGLGGLVAPPLLALAALGLLAAILVALSAGIPPLMVWQFNRSQ